MNANEAIVHFSASLQGRTLIILFMNKVNIISYKNDAFQPDSFPAVSTGEILALETIQGTNKKIILKWFLSADDKMNLNLEVACFDADFPPAAIIGSNGKMLSGGEVKRNLPLLPSDLNPKESDHLAKEFATWLITTLRGENAVH
jgi:hypothetical protein